MSDAAAGVRDRALAGLRVLVTRPQHQSDALAALIEARGGTALRFPVIEILAARDEDQNLAQSSLRQHIEVCSHRARRGAFDRFRFQLAVA